MNYENLPKIELHLHLDCCLSFEVVKKLNPSITFHEYEESFIAPPKCYDLADYINRAVKGFELMQTKETLEIAAQGVTSASDFNNVVAVFQRSASRPCYFYIALT